jgi:hypothetical protein
MSTSTNVRALRQWFVDLLATDPTFDDVEVAPSWRTELNANMRRIFLTGVTPDDGTSVPTFRGGTKRYEHRFRIGVEIHVRENGTREPADAESVALALYDAIRDLLADNVVPRDASGSPLAYQAVMGDWESELGPTDSGSGAIVTTSIRFHVET